MEEGLSDSGSLSLLYIETFFPPPVSVVCNALSRTLVLASLPDFEILWFFQFIHAMCLLLFQTHVSSLTEDSDVT